MILKYKELIFVFLIFLVGILYHSQANKKSDITVASDKKVRNARVSNSDIQMSMSEFMVNKSSQATKYRKKSKKRKFTGTLKDSLRKNILDNNETNRTQLVLNKYYKLKKLSLKTNNPNIKDDDNITVLMYATFAQDYTFIGNLINQGANINAISKMGSTALMLSALKKDLDMTKKLIEFGAEINLNGAHNPLLISTRLGDLKTVKYLVEHGADIESETLIKRRTPLMNALAYGENIEISKYLIAKGASAVSQDYLNMDAILFAAASGDIERIKLVESITGNLLVTSTKGRNILMSASEFGNKEVIDYLVRERDIDIDMVDNNNQNALINSTVLLNFETTKALLDNNINVDAKMLSGKVNVLGGFIGMRPDTKDENIINDEIKMVELLIKNGVDIHSKSISGMTPLHYAVIRNKKKIVETLIKNGVDLTQKDNKGATALYYAHKQNNLEMIDLLNKETK